jgi:hypothetical protein
MDNFSTRGMETGANLRQDDGPTVLPVKTIDEIRRANLLLLISEAGNASRLSALTEVSPPIISQVSRGVARSEGGKARVMGDTIARRLESKMGKPRGWMDIDHSAISIAADLNGREGQLVGLFRLLNDAEQIELINELTRKLRRTQIGPAANDGPGIRH